MIYFHIIFLFDICLFLSLHRNLKLPIFSAVLKIVKVLQLDLILLACLDYFVQNLEMEVIECFLSDAVYILWKS